MNWPKRHWINFNEIQRNQKMSVDNSKVDLQVIINFKYVEHSSDEHNRLETNPNNYNKKIK